MFALAFLTAFSFVYPCPADEKTDAPAYPLKIVTTIFPAYDWVMNILGENQNLAEVTMMMDNGVDLHNFQPTVENIVEISGCDLFIYVGGVSDQWIRDALEEAVNEDMVVLNLLALLGDEAKEEEPIPGLTADDPVEEGAVLDEHVWLSLKNATILVRQIAEAIKGLDSAHAADYEANTEAYVEELTVLDSAYASMVSEAAQKTLLFGDRFPFRYLTDDYGLNYFAAFDGCSAETEASFETITFLSGKMDELALHHILTIDGSDQRIAETIIQNTASRNQEILTLNSMQSATLKDWAEGVTYLSIMKDNLSVLEKALSS